MIAPSPTPFDPTRWRTSAASGANGGCVEVNTSVAGVVGLRDSKLGDTSPVIEFSDDQWTAWLAEITAGTRTYANGVVVVDEHNDGGWTLRANGPATTLLEFTAFEVACFRDGVLADEFLPGRGQSTKTGLPA